MFFSVGEQPTVYLPSCCSSRHGWEVESSLLMKVPEMLTGPRGRDPHHMEKVLPTTLRRYREALRPFVAFLLENILSPSEAAEWDDLLMEYKHEHMPRRAAFEALVAALEFANPRVKGGLTWCRVTIAGWAIAAPIHHTVLFFELHADSSPATLPQQADPEWQLVSLSNEN